MKKKILAAFLLVCALALSTAPTAWAAEDAVLPAVEQTWQADDENWPSSEELFAGYVEQQLYGDSGIETYGLNAVHNAFAGNDFNQKLYDVLKAKIQDVAANGGSTVFTVTFDELGLKTSWTWAELGYSNDPSETDRKAAVSKAVPISGDMFKVLLMDCPYEMYWCDKSASGAFSRQGSGYSYNSTGFTLTGSLTFTFKVGAAYADNGDTTKVKAAVTDVKAKALEIIDKYKGQSDYNRLLGYKDEICALVSYNDYAAANGSSTVGVDPWQIVYVFDGDETTNVVCEGYAKAFQYLCDLDGGIDCYIVTGTMSGGTGAGGHMWNIVRLNNKSYLVDVTNCDDGTIGNPDKLFLKAPTSSTVASSYSFNLSGTITFTYDNDTRSLWGDTILTLATEDYNPDETPADVLVTNIMLNKTSLALVVDDSETLTATVVPANATNKNVTWTSSNEKVATVDNAGKVTAVAAGTATITATAADGSGVKATCNVTVTSIPVQTVAVTGVSLNETALNLEIGGTAALTATVAPENATNKNVTWKSSNEKVATVDNTGKVTAVAAGTATITVTTADGNKTATCAVTVVEKKIPVTSITLDKTTLSLEVKTTAQLKAAVLPVDTTSTISWTSSNEKVAIVDNTGKVTPLTKGTATITAAADGVKATCTVTITADTVYTITFDTNGGTLQAGVTNPDYVTKGKEYKMPTATRSGYKLTAWAIGAQDSENKVNANEVYTFTADTTVYAVWQYNSSSSGGSSSRPTTSGGTTTSGTTTTEKPGTTTTNPGTSSGSNTVTAANIKNVFADVQNNAWYSEAIAYVYNNGIMNGTENGFEPNATTTRAMLVTMLFRLEGEPAAGNPVFSDVASGQWFSNAIAWAASQGVVNGYENGLFGPNDSITREQLAVILYRFAQLKGYAVSANGSLSSFSDSGSVSDWAQEAMQWAVGAGIINGDNGALKPAGNATRAEVATMLMRFSENIAK